MPRDPVLIVGTTPDYILKIHRTHPDGTVFITDDRFRDDPLLASVPESSLLFVPLEKHGRALDAVRRLCGSRDLSPRGVACFDCDSLVVANRLALGLGNRFPPAQAIARARNKFESKRIWRKAGVSTPAGVLASNLVETLSFFHQNPGGVVVKPVSGSGSELAFHCKTEGQVRESVGFLREELPRRRGNPLFRPVPSLCTRARHLDPCAAWVVEEFVPGQEFSCDFFLDDGNIKIVRETRKIRAPDQTFGSVLAYIFPAHYPDGISRHGLVRLLKKASISLGFDWGHFMVDFIVRNGAPVILEMAPRPGGDSIPDLVGVATGEDLLGMHLDFVSGRPPRCIAARLDPESFASVNLFAPHEGVITRLDVSEIRSLPKVKAVFLRKDVGDTITLPPADYDNRVLGYCVLSIGPGTDLFEEHRRIAKALRVSISPQQRLTAQPALNTGT